MSKPICFVVMPFREKETGVSADKGPARVDFDQLWEKAFRRAIEDAGLVPVRADQETGAVILQEMIESLALADVVLADVSIANPNVYYEIGVRHALPGDNYRCVLIGAEWAQSAFDLGQIRHVPYKLTDGRVPDAEARAIHAMVRDLLVRATQQDTQIGSSPLRTMLPGYPAGLDAGARVDEFRRRAGEVSEIATRMQAARMAPPEERGTRARELRDQLLTRPGLLSSIRIELLKLLRDCTDWPTTLAYIDSLPPALEGNAFVREQRLLAIAKTGADTDAIAALAQLIRERGASSERHGLLGGRYKALWRREGEGADSPHLDDAIEQYTKGMHCDLNDYYPSCNLPRLLRARGREGDEAAAVRAEAVAYEACQRALARQSGDEWLRSTLLGLAFSTGDLRGAGELLRVVRREGHAAWKLDATIKDLRKTVAQTKDPEVRAGLGKMVEDLELLIPKAPGATP